MSAGGHLDLTGRCALVTGAARGLGKAIALRLAENGARVLVSGRDEAALADVGGGKPSPRCSKPTSPRRSTSLAGWRKG